MAIDYTRLALVAQRLIDENGRSCTLIKDSETPTDPTKPWRGTQVDPMNPPADYLTAAVTAVFLKREFKEGNDTVRKGTQNVYVSPLDVLDDLTQFDTLVDGNIVWHINDVKLLCPGVSRLLWILELEE